MQGLLFSYPIFGGNIHHVRNYSKGVAKLSELCLQLNTVVFARIITMISLFFKDDHAFLSLAYRTDNYSLL